MRFNSIRTFQNARSVAIDMGLCVPRTRSSDCYDLLLFPACEIRFFFFCFFFSLFFCFVSVRNFWNIEYVCKCYLNCLKRKYLQVCTGAHWFIKLQFLSHSHKLFIRQFSFASVEKWNNSVSCRMILMEFELWIILSVLI